MTITLHNQIAGESVSFALPGQAPPPSTAPLVTTPTGVATGGTTDYSFTAGRPGTFLYEAGHTSNGSRQVAMGLAGALVVLPGDGTAYGTSGHRLRRRRRARRPQRDRPGTERSSGGPSTCATSAPKYRLINGKPFPASDPITTDQGHTVLLRYVNVGSEAHSMSTLGADADRRSPRTDTPRPTRSAWSSETVEPGQTADTLVHHADRARGQDRAVRARREHLDNNAQTTADPLPVRLRRHADLPRHGSARSERRRRRTGLPAHHGVARTRPTGSTRSPSPPTSVTRPPAGPRSARPSSSSTTP